MKRLLQLSVILGFLLVIQGCAVYPYAPPVYTGYAPYYGYRPYAGFGWGGGYRGGHGWGEHRGWGGHGRH